ncbi:hypothetical protein DL93DRAFT_2124081 [Clavulina sp. PMI_390]|nr:hypothetical protein DL93DRAFT_2124081 [Clavulina sp. PMI_390]
MIASLELASAPVVEEPIEMSFTHAKLVEEVRKTRSMSGSKNIASMIVIGHVDAGKSTLMGRLLYELGEIAEKQRISNERASEKIGKSSFSWAWTMDSLGEERDRGVTMDITQTSVPLPHVDLTILDAPGHRDFVPNLISGASQADAALLVVDAGTGEFEAGFSGGGQTREHILLVRSLGVSSLIVAVNKLDTVGWSQARFDEISSTLKPFLVQSGYHPSKITFIPCAAMKGVNLTKNEGPELQAWYKGPTIADQLDTLTSPTRDIEAAVRLPVSNVFRGGVNSSGLGISGRLLTGVIQPGEKLRVLPGDETATIRRIEIEENVVPWAAAGDNVTVYLSGIERISIGVGSVLCPASSLVPLASKFVAQIILFDLSLPVTSGATVELFHQSRDTPATISKLIETIDRASGKILKTKPRVLTKNSSARVEIQLRSPTTFGNPANGSGATTSGTGAKSVSIPIETFTANKDMGRVLLRRNGETIGAGIITEIIG